VIDCDTNQTLDFADLAQVWIKGIYGQKPWTTIINIHFSKIHRHGKIFLYIKN